MLEDTNSLDGAHIEKTTSLPAARCEQNFILTGIGKLYYFYNIFLSIRASIPVRTVLYYSLTLLYGDVYHKCLSLKKNILFRGQMGVPSKKSEDLDRFHTHLP